MKKLISIILASIILSGTAAGAIEIQKDWVNVSAWTYNDVSNFTNEGLLPDSFEGINDYRADITREQLAELIYSVFYKKNEEKNELNELEIYNQPEYRIFADTNNPVINYLYDHSIVNGTEKLNDPYSIAGDKGFFMPDAPITREDAAVMINRAAGFPYPYNLIGEFDDDSDIHDYAKQAVYSLSTSGIIQGTGSNIYEPLAHISIEQSIVALMRVYLRTPEANDIDAAGFIGVEKELELKRYGNGLYETVLGDKLYIKTGENTVMEFETDIYSNLLCARNGDRDYILARNFKKRTEVYDAGTKNLLYTIPYPVKKAENGYIYTISTASEAWFYGLYDFEGNEVLPTEYSEHEINELIKNGFKDEAKASHNLYYCVYNAENEAENGVFSLTDGKQSKICDMPAKNILIADGRLYFISTPNKEGEFSTLYSIKPDGSELVKISEGTMFMYAMTDGGREYVYYDRYERNILTDGQSSADGAVYSTHFFSDGSYQIYKEYGDEVEIGPPRLAPDYMYRVSFSDGKPIEERVCDMEMYNAKYCDYDKCVYFRSDDSYFGKPSDLYRFDGRQTVKICSDAAGGLSFRRDGVIIDLSDNETSVMIKYGATETETLNFFDEVSVSGDKVTREAGGIANMNNYSLERGVSDEKFRVYSNNEETIVINSNGDVINHLGKTHPMYRHGDTLYTYVSGFIESLDMSSFRSEIISETAVYEYRADEENGLFLFKDIFGNIYSTSLTDGTTEHVYPNHAVVRQDAYSEFKNMLLLRGFNHAPTISDYCMADGSDKSVTLP